LRVVVKLGGHAFPLRPDSGRLSGYARVFRRLREAGHGVVVVAGGGAVARSYIEAARGLGANEALCDQLAIAGTRLNARLLVTALGGDAHPNVPTDLEELGAALEGGRIAVLGGLLPGQSTDAVAAMVSELVGASLLIKASDTDGIYTADPKKDPRAKRLERLSCTQLMEMVMREPLKAGEYEVLDPVAVKIIARSGIATRYIDGRDPENIERAIRGEEIGTLVTP